MHVGEAVERAQNEQQIDQLARVAVVNENVVVTIDGLNRGCSEIAHRVPDGRLSLVAVSTDAIAAFSGRQPQRVGASIYTHRRRGRVCQ
jgi:hypothetical protein